MMKLVVRTSKDPFVSFEPNSMTVNATGTVTAYAIQPNATLTSLFVLNLVGYTDWHDKKVNTIENNNFCILVCRKKLLKVTMLTGSPNCPWLLTG